VITIKAQQRPTLLLHLQSRRQKKPYQLNFIDTCPANVDSIMKSVARLAGLRGALLVVTLCQGVKAQSVVRNC